ncbi:MAG: hypothetical protein R3E79_59950 [Caldilineaceae bacterium]
MRREVGYRASAPVVESYVTAIELDAQPMRLLGIDLYPKRPFAATWVRQIKLQHRRPII